MKPTAISWGTAALMSLVTAAQADVFVLTNGDRVTGQRLRSTTRTIVVQTEYGRLTLPRAKVERIVKDDGTEEVMGGAGGAAPAPGAAPAAPAEPAPVRAGMPMGRIVVIITGQSFWLAWDPKNNPNVDPSLRMEVQLDGQTIASYVDGKADPKDLPGATVNTFSFLAGDTDMEAEAGARLERPEVRPGRAALRMAVPFPSDAPVSRKLRVTYQFNAGTREKPEWKDAVSAEAPFDMGRGTPNFLLLKQAMGKMQFSGFPRRRMRNIQTFRMDLAPGV
jgi:hypothetical protein